MKYKLFKDIHFNPLHPPPPAHHAAAISKTAAGLLPHGDCGTGRMPSDLEPKRHTGDDYGAICSFACVPLTISGVFYFEHSAKYAVHDAMKSRQF